MISSATDVGRNFEFTGQLKSSASRRSQPKHSIFISYARKDNESSAPEQRWLDRLLEHLTPLELQGEMTIWSDKEVEIGEDWHGKIQAQLRTAKVAVLLVSSAFLASKYI